MATQAQFTGRRSNREPVKKIAHLFALSENELHGAGAYTLDLSKHGSRVHTILEVSPGQILEFHPEDSERPLLCRVVWMGNGNSRPQAEVGLEFLGPVPFHMES
jgi:PilZ domain